MTNERPWLSRNAVWLFIGLVGSCVLTAGALFLFIPPRLQSHQDQIAYTLKQHGVAYQEIKLAQTASDTQYYFAYAGYFIYGADVTIQLADGRVVVGRIECRVRDSGCRLSIAALGLQREQLPELDSNNQWFWLDWLRQLLSRLGSA